MKEKTIGDKSEVEYVHYVFFFIISLLLMSLIIGMKDGLIPDFPGYENYLNNGVWHYLTSRPLHIIPLAISSISFILFAKVAITGECPVILEPIKGLSLGRLIAFNYGVAYLFIVPFLLELCISIGIAVIYATGTGFFIINGARLTSKLWVRFNEACK